MKEKYSMLNEELAKKYEMQKWRPNFHFTAPQNWLNDPNGLIYFKGYYHLFYQHNPYSCEWGQMHWGHAISMDMVYWYHLPIALSPDKKYDSYKQGGCFSGSAVEHEGRLYVFYTGVAKQNNRTLQTQCLAISNDGISFEKYEGNPIIDRLPAEHSTGDFRDPKVFKYEDKWYMVLGSSLGGADTGGDGRVLLYVSKDLFQWEFCSAILKSKGRFGTMCECPDFFPIEDKWVLTFSPMYHPQMKKAIYCIGDMDFSTYEFRIEKVGDMDLGFDYYASQSLNDANGNRVCIAWQNGWLWMPWCDSFGPTTIENWRCSMSIPRKVSLDASGLLKFSPIEALSSLYKNISVKENFYIEREKTFIQIPYESYKLSVKGKVKKVDSRAFEIGLKASAEKQTVIYVDLINQILSLDLDNADGYSSGRIFAPMELRGGKFEIEVLVDKSSIEIYVDGGLNCITCNIYPEEDQIHTWIKTPYKDAIIDEVRFCKIESIWNNSRDTLKTASDTAKV